MSKIEYKNLMEFNQPTESDCPLSPQETMYIKDEIKIFAYKYMFSEADCTRCPNDVPGKGDDLGFALVYGNYGERCYYPSTSNPIPTVEDVLDLSNIESVSIEVMDVCLPKDMIMVIVAIDNNPITPSVKVEKGYKFVGGHTYTLQIQSGTNGNYTPYFCLCCHQICCASILGQIDFTACIPESGNTLVNGDFNVRGVCSLDGWTIENNVQATNDARDVNNGNSVIVDPSEDICVALLSVPSDQDPAAILSQTFLVSPSTTTRTLSFDYYYSIPLGDSSNEVSFTLNNNTPVDLQASAPYSWNNYSVVLPADYCGAITIKFKIDNDADFDDDYYVLAIKNVMLV